MGPKDRRKRCKNDTSSDIAVPLKPDQEIFLWDAERTKTGCQPDKPLFSGVDEQSRKPPGSVVLSFLNFVFF